MPLAPKPSPDYPQQIIEAAELLSHADSPNVEAALALPAGAGFCSDATQRRPPQLQHFAPEVGAAHQVLRVEHQRRVLSNHSWFKLGVIHEYDHNIGGCELASSERHEWVVQVLGVDVWDVRITKLNRGTSGSQAPRNFNARVSHSRLLVRQTQ